jgi:aminoglycoside phosphotransferase (APT) family kinase protein
MAAFGKSLIVDPGRYTYDEAGETNWRVWFRGTSAHNTVLIDGKNQTRYEFYKRKFKIKGDAPDHEWKTFVSRDGFDFLHGLARSHEYPVIHERKIFFVRGEYWIVSDVLRAAEPHEYDLRFHLSEAAFGQTTMQHTNHTRLIAAPNLLLAQVFEPNITAEIEAGFVSRTYGVKSLAPVVSFKTRAANVCYNTILFPHQAAPPALTVEHRPVFTASRRCLATEATALLTERVARCRYASSEVAACAILQVWRKIWRKNPHKSFLTVLYQLTLTTGAQPMVYVKAYLDQRSHAEFLQHVNDVLAPADGTAALMHAPELDAVLWHFPNDPSMPQLADVVCAERVKTRLPYHALSAEWNCPHDVTVSVVKYRPEARCLAKYELRSATSSLTLFGKTFADALGQAVYARTETMWRLAQQNQIGFQVARPLSFDAATKTMWQEWLDGTPLAECLTPQNYPTLFPRIAQGLASLQRQPVATNDCVMLPFHLREMQKKTAKLSQRFPTLAAAFAAQYHALAAALPRFANVPVTTLHGDFHLRQMLLRDDALALFDFDEWGAGDPLQDVAHFIADLYSYHFAPALVQAMATTFLAAYAHALRHASQRQRRARVVEQVVADGGISMVARREAVALAQSQRAVVRRARKSEFLQSQSSRIVRADAQ